MIQLRPYQNDTVAGVFNGWNSGSKNMLAVLPTGAGKTVVATSILNSVQGFRLACAHRSELVSQISLAFAKIGVYHRIFAPNSVVHDIESIHRLETGLSFVNMNAPTAVSSIGTLISRKSRGDSAVSNFLSQVAVWFQDEAHHVLEANQWGKVVKWCPQALGLGVTATPLRADGKGLGAHTDGVFHDMVVGPSMYDLIQMGFLCDYAPPICPPTDMKIDQIKVGANGDFTMQGMKKAAQESHIVGDVVKHYCKFAYGKLGITFATDVETAGNIAQAYRDAGIAAEAVSGQTPELVRHDIVRRFKKRELLQLVNVDLFGEGFDLPALEVVSMARPTQSYGLYVQQFGRALRPMEGKDKAIIIDHVNNVRTHLLPDHGRPWSLDRRQKRAKREQKLEIPRATCENPDCFRDYEAVTKTCPYCGHTKEPSNRSAPEFVDGDLVELTPEALEKLRNAVLSVDAPLGITPDTAVKAGMVKNHKERQEAQKQLRHTMALWAGMRKAEGDDDRVIERKFWHLFGTDIISAQALGRPDALALQSRIMEAMS